MPKSMPNRKRLTDLAVGRIGPGPITWDTLLPCFGIRPGTRTKTWIVNDQGSKHKVGKFPAMSTAEARTKAREMLEGGAKPLAGERLFKTLVEEFLQHARTRKGRPWRDNTTIQYRRNLALYGAPLRERPFAEINRRDVAALLRDVANT
jgi:hypothetical protein